MHVPPSGPATLRKKYRIVLPVYSYISRNKIDHSVSSRTRGRIRTTRVQWESIVQAKISSTCRDICHIIYRQIRRGTAASRAENGSSAF